MDSTEQPIQVLIEIPPNRTEEFRKVQELENRPSARNTAQYLLLRGLDGWVPPVSPKAG